MGDTVSFMVAGTEDIPALIGLLGELFGQEAEFVPDRAAQERGLGMIINDPAIGEIFIAKEADSIIGMANLLYTVSTALGARVAILEDVIISEGYRSKGIGQKLLQHAMTQAKENGCKRITLLTDRDNIQGQTFYRKLGFSDSDMIPMRYFP